MFDFCIGIHGVDLRSASVRRGLRASGISRLSLSCTEVMSGARDDLVRLRGQLERDGLLVIEMDEQKTMLIQLL